MLTDAAVETVTPALRYPLPPPPSPRLGPPLALGLLALQAATAAVLLGRMLPWPLIAACALGYAAALTAADRRGRLDAEVTMLARAQPAPVDAVEVLAHLCDRLGCPAPRLLMTHRRGDLRACEAGVPSMCRARDAVVYAEPDRARLNGGEFQALLAAEVARIAQRGDWLRRDATTTAVAVVLAAVGAGPAANRPAAAFVLTLAATVGCCLGLLAISRARERRADMVAVRATASPRLGFAIQALSATGGDQADAGGRARLAVSDEYLERYLGHLDAALAARGLRRRLLALFSLDADPLVRLREVVARGNTARSARRWAARTAP